MVTTTELPLFASLARYGNASMIAVDCDARITSIVGRIKLRSSFDDHAAIGQPIESYFADDPEHAKLYRDALQNRPSKVIIDSLFGGFSEVQVLPIFGENNKIVGAFGFESASGLDISERSQIALEKLEANELSRLVFESVPMPCAIIDKKFKVIDCNPEILKLFNIPNKKIFQEQFADLFPKYQPDGRVSLEKVAEKWADVFEKGHLQFEWLLQEPGGGVPIPLEVTLVRIQWENDQVIVAYGRDLREEHRMLTKKRESDDRAQILFDATPLCCVLWDESLDVIDCNMEAVKMFDMKEKSDFCKRFYELSPKYQPDGRSSRELAVEHAAKALEKHIHRFEWIHQKLDGTPIPAEVTLIRVHHEGVFTIAGYVRDLREEKAILAEKREADERTRIMLDATPLGCTLLNKRADIIDCNVAAYKLFGLTNKQEYMERFYYDLMPEYQPDGQPSRERALDEILEAFETGHRCIEWWHKTGDGTLVPTEVTLVRVKQGEEYIVAGYTRDLREIKQHEAIQERNQQRSSALLELAQMTQQSELDIIDYTIKAAISLTDSVMGYVVLLEHAKDVLPFRSLILDQSLHCSLPMQTDMGTPHALSTVLTDCLTSESVIIHNDVAALPGSRTFPEGHCIVHSHMNVAIVDDEKTIGILGVGNKSAPYNDIDGRHISHLAQGLSNLLNRKKYAEALEQAKIEAENANRAKSEFLAHMSHEIRTPLNGVIGLSDLLTGTSLNKKQNEYVQLINASGKTLLFLINDILDFSKIEAGKLEIESESFDLATTIGSVLAALISRANDKRLELGVSFCRNLPQFVWGDSGRVRQVLLNLVGNAVKFTTQGGVRVDVTIESVVENTVTVKFSVVDTGIGIPRDKIDRLFKAFSQVDASSARVYGGTGLGLAISMQLVRLFGGNIGVESIPRKGSTFWFTVPFKCDDSVIQCILDDECLDRTCRYLDGHTCTAFVNREICTEHSTVGRSVLIVDDNEVLCEAVRIQLKNWGMKCVVCSSGSEAFRLATEHWKNEDPFDLFIIDSTLADGSSVDLLEKLYEQEEKLNGTKFAQAILLRSLLEDVTQDIQDDNRTETIGKPVFASMLFNAVMNRIFAAEQEKSIESGVLTSDDARGEKKMRPGSARHTKTVKQFLDPPVQRAESYLAGQIHVLIVEDNRVNQIVAKNLLEEVGFTCDIANDGIEACSAVRHNQYDIVLMDCQMPAMDGFEATRLIRDWENEHGKKRLPIIALTANATREDVAQCLESGMDAYCSKPINPAVMIRLIEEWYEKSKNG